MHPYKAFTYCFIFLISLSACKSSEQFTGYSYDPPNVTDTRDKGIELQKRRVVGVDSPKVWISNEFSGARFTDFFMDSDSTYRLIIEPENEPINNSPWYAFKIWSDRPAMIPLTISYPDGRHRYQPKSILEKGENGLPYAFLPVLEDSSSGDALIYIPVGRNKRIVSAQPLQTSEMIRNELIKRNILGPSFTKIDTIGYSKQGRPLIELTITENSGSEKKPVLVILSRQHPPEVTGYLGALSALKALTADEPMARQFRETFVIKAYPMVNPDGVDNGHWRHNAGGVDLNRDWQYFNQPETAAIRNAITSFMDEGDYRMIYAIDYHSTDENIFYPILSDIKTTPDNITQQWIPLITEEYPDIVFNIEEFDTNSPISKNWFYHTYGVDALTYEIDDRMPTAVLDEVSYRAMHHLMDLLLKNWVEISSE
ncbi:M14 family metallopeptidase [Balneola sp. MJW-20]|uniref:M14 family metallopeptidase n=1 Tax=Gracilimonas aurantiaca TaxID=3234185 RepID=UPI003908DA3A